MILRECMEAKYRGQEEHFWQARGSFAICSKLLAQEDAETLKRRVKQ